MKKLNIAVCGSAAQGLQQSYKKKAYQVGKAIAKANCILFNGATGGFSYEAVKGAKKVKGITIGISPAENRLDQLARFEKVDDKHWTTIIYTGTGYKIRDVIMIRSVDAAIFIGGGVGTLLEMTVAIDSQKVLGILEGSGGATELIEKLEEISHRTKPVYVIEKDPEKLVKSVIKLIKKRGNK